MEEISPSISIVIPVYNEEDNVEKLHCEIQEILDHLKQPYEIIFVEDGSSDNTLEYLKNIKRTEHSRQDSIGKTKIIRLARNFGQTAALQAGFDHASGEFIVTMDGDMQNDPADIPRLLDKLDQGFDVVSGWRKNREDKTITRIIPSKVANWLIRKVTGIQVHDQGCALKAYRSTVIKSLQIYSDMHRFISILTTQFGARVAEMVVNHRSRKYGKTKYGLSRTWKVMFDMITIKMLIHFYNRPILWFAGLGIIFFLFGIFFALVSAYQFLEGKSILVFGTSSVLFFALFGGIMSWGLLAEFFVKVENSVPALNIKNSYSTEID